MTSPVTKAMIESYALMVMVMGTFFVYFCGMVWAFCNPKLSGAEEESGTGTDTLAFGDDCWVCAPNPPGQSACRCSAGAHLPPPQYNADWLTQTTYINFWDTDSLLSECTGYCREDQGITNKSGTII